LHSKNDEIQTRDKEHWGSASDVSLRITESGIVQSSRQKIDPDLVRIDKTGGGEVVINHRPLSLTAGRTKIGGTKTIFARTNEDEKSLKPEQHCLLPGLLPVL